ncbi:MAG TPA: two-component regulator propeller domain-containing protein [Verrucomicrobiota bacterium]|nr:two-component regulator propeller domain-containing protein [Verrucomicrobiota bacterium]
MKHPCRRICHLPARAVCRAWITLLLCAAHGLPDEVRAQTNGVNPQDEFAIQILSTEHGLPQNTATDVIQTRRGYIWVATYNGIAQFDGLRFRVFDSSNTKGLANSRITALHEDQSGTIWIGHDTGEVSRCSDETFSRLALPAAWTSAPVKDFAEDERGDIWVLNQRGDAWRTTDGFIARPPPLMADDPFVNPRVATDATRRLIVTRNGVVARLTSKGYEVIDFGDEATRPFYGGVASSRDGQMWVLGEGRVRKWDGTNWTHDIGPLPRPGMSIVLVQETSSGLLLVGTLQYGLFVYDPNRGWIVLNREDGLPQDWICGIAEDREKNIWVGTAGGLALLRQRKVTMLSPPDQWQGRPVLSITQTRSGDIWAATEGAGLYRLDGRDWEHFGSTEGLSNLFMWSVMEDSRGHIWAGSWGGGLYRRTHRLFSVQTNLTAIADPVTALKEFPDGTLWIGTGKGLVRWDGVHAERFDKLGGAAAGDVRVIEIGHDGAVWIGTQGYGLARLKDGSYKTYGTADGLPGNFILSLYCEPDGTLWIGTLDMGLCRFKDGQFRTMTTEHGLPANIIYHIEDDTMGNLWFNSPVGLFRIHKGQLNACADGDINSLLVLAYGKAEGLATLAGTGGFTPSGFRSQDGRLWFSTTRGIAVVDPRRARPNPARPPVWIEDVLVDGQSVRFDPLPLNGVTRNRRSPGLPPPIQVQPGRRQIEMIFTGLSFTSPERVQFKYRMQGIDSEWTDAGTRRRVTYSFLPPGDYVFRVIACNSDGLWNESGASVAVRVLPQFWQSLWFRLLAALVICASVGAGVYYLARSRHRRKLEIIARERALERERARIAQDIHDDLGASLTRIGLLSEASAGEVENHPRAASNLEQILTTTRELTRSMDEIVWAVNPRHDTLESLTNYVAQFSQDFLSAARIRCRLDVPLQLPELSVRSEVRHNLFLACKEALNNVVKHSGATEARLTIETVPGGLRFVITDNGKGFDAARLKTGDGAQRPAAGNGLPNLEARLRQIGGRSRIECPSGGGTRVEFFVPLRDAVHQPRKFA